MRSPPETLLPCTGRCSRSGCSSNGCRASSARARSPASCTSTSARRRSPQASARTSTTTTTSRARTAATGTASRRGATSTAMMAEIYGREDGLCKGRGGSMHIADFSRGMLGANAIVGGGIALATGAGARGDACAASGQVAVAFFGDGAANQGVLHESLNLAAIWKLPVIYVCENNGFAESTPGRVRDERRPTSRRAPPATGSPASSSTAPTCSASTRPRATRSHGRAPARARRCSRSRRYRFMGHFEGDPDRYRDDDGARGAARVGCDPARSARASARRRRTRREAELDAMRAEIEAASTPRSQFARASPFPDPADDRALRLPGAARARGGAPDGRRRRSARCRWSTPSARRCARRWRPTRP